MQRRTSSLGTTRRRLGTGAVLSMAAGLVGATLAASPAQAADNPFERGPDPTSSSIRASQGAFRTASSSIGLGARGFGGGQIYYPTGTSETFGVIALSPGFTASWSSISWLGPRLASQGFVVVGIETNSRLDQPAQRGTQLLAALDWAVSSSPSAARARIDRNRQAVGGHSMGGGGTLEASADRPSLRAGVPLAPWNTDKSWNNVRVPQAIIGGESDTVASVSSHSIPFYNSLAGPKIYMELNNASHFFPQSVNANQQALSVAFYKRYVDGDTRYSQFLTRSANSGTAISDFRSSGIG